MTRLTIIVLFLFITFFAKPQEICFKINSIECYRIPWQLKSNRNIHANELINGVSFSSWISKTTVFDKQALDYFIKSNFTDTSKVLNFNKPIEDIDTRAVIIIKYDNGFKDTLVFNGSSSYYYRGIVYLANIKILLWLMEYVPLIDTQSDFIKEENIENLRIEHEYMLELNAK